MINLHKYDYLIGTQINRLKIIGVDEEKSLKNGHIYMKCECQCESKTKLIVYVYSLLNNNTCSCGCYNKEKTIEASKKQNKYDLSGECGIGYDSKGNKFYFDLEDYDKIKDYCWNANNQGYIRANANKGKKSTNVKLHRIIMDLDYSFNDNRVVDHINGNPLDNRKENLRICKQNENCMNTKIPNNNKSGIKGVCWNNRDKNWRAFITYNKKRYELGCYSDKEEAIMERLKKEKELFGDFSNQKELFEKYNI